MAGITELIAAMLVWLFDVSYPDDDIFPVILLPFYLLLYQLNVFRLHENSQSAGYLQMQVQDSACVILVAMLVSGFVFIILYELIRTVVTPAFDGEFERWLSEKREERWSFGERLHSIETPGCHLPYFHDNSQFTGGFTSSELREDHLRRAFLSTTDFVQAMAKEMLTYINDALELQTAGCSKLELDEIMHAELQQNDAAAFQETVYLLRIRTSPGKMLFEGTLVPNVTQNPNVYTTQHGNPLRNAYIFHLSLKTQD
ncbi:hypothetical protein B566_EDAN014746 [Ephemera danica]|nr:hypothetical protein B566_EDAN014746 [Ephemera danica]